MKSGIAIVGSLNMDVVVTTERMPKPGETVQGLEIHYVPGGKGANQAVGCARLGSSVSMIGAVGDDSFARMIRNRLTEDGIRTEHIATIEETSTGIASITHTKEDNCIVVVPGANAHCTPELVERHRETIAGAGLLLLQLEIPLKTVHAALRMAREAGVATVLNPAPATTIPNTVLQLADYLTPNETEFEALSGWAGDSEQSLERLMNEWEAEYGNKLIVTRGERGCSFLRHHRLHTVPSPSVEVVDTTGAGDAFNAALAYGLSLGREAETCISFAVQAASLSVTRFGAQAGMPTLQEVNRALGSGPFLAAMNDQ